MGSFPMKLGCVESGTAGSGREAPASALPSAFLTPPGGCRGGPWLKKVQCNGTDADTLCSCVREDKERRQVSKQPVCSLFGMWQAKLIVCFAF